MKMKVLAIVVVYNPAIEALLSNIQTYYEDVEHVLILDNSTKPDIKKELKERSGMNNILYKDMNGNHGIAVALNHGFQYALSLSCNWVLTMDQDSCFISRLTGFYQYLDSVSVEKLIFLAPVYSVYDKSVSNRTVRNRFIWQSGNLVQVANYYKLGSYLEKLFIDYVDYEYCLRAHRFGYDYLQISSVVLKHNPGILRVGHFLGIKYRYSDSSLTRYYYFFRNGCYVISVYKNLQCVFQLVKILVKIILLEQQKKKKLIWAYRGFLDFCKGRFGNLADII